MFCDGLRGDMREFRNLTHLILSCNGKNTMRPFIALIFLLCQPVISQTRITPAEAKNHIGQEMTVCGNVANSRQASTRGQPTFLNLDKKYPNPMFTIVIWGRD